MAGELERIQRKIERLVLTREKDIELFARQIMLNIREAFAVIERDLALARPGAIEAAQRINQLENILIQNGFTEEFRQIRELYSNELSAIRELSQTLQDIGIYSESARISIGGLDNRAVQTLINMNVQPITKTLNSLNIDFKAEMFRSMVTGSGIDLSEITDSLTTKYYNYVRTELNTNMAVFNREVNRLAAADAGFDLYLYIGPLDDVTRSFCRDLLTKGVPVYSMDRISRMKNGQIGDVFTSAGGYNCRHEWVPITAEYAQELGYRG